MRGLPRLLLNSLGPIAGYAAGSRLAGVLGGMLAATVVSLSLWAWERHAGRPGVLARLSLVLVLIQAGLGFLSHSAFLYFAPRSIVDLLQGLAHYVSCFTRRPLAAILGRELVTLPRSDFDKPPVRRLFVLLTVVWGTYFTLRGAITLVVLVAFSTEAYLLVRALLDAPLVVPLAAASLAYGTQRLRALTAVPDGAS